jgi:transcription antitermination factor NusG
MANHSWAVAASAPLREYVLHDFLIKNNLTCYLPSYRRQHKQRASVFIKRPLFPGYLFFALVEQWQRIFGMQHSALTGIIMNGEKPSIVENGLIDGIKAREVDGFVCLDEVEFRFRRGAEVRVLDGQFEGLHGVFDSYCDQQRVKVLFEMMGRSAAVVMNADEIELSKKEPAKKKRYRGYRGRRYLASLAH